MTPAGTPGAQATCGSRRATPPAHPRSSHPAGDNVHASLLYSDPRTSRRWAFPQKEPRAGYLPSHSETPGQRPTTSLVHALPTVGPAPPPGPGGVRQPPACGGQTWRLYTGSALATAGFGAAQTRFHPGPRAWGLPVCLPARPPQGVGLTHQGRDARVAVDQGQAGQADDDVPEHGREEGRRAAAPLTAQRQHRGQARHHLRHHPAGRAKIRRACADARGQTTAFCSSPQTGCRPPALPGQAGQPPTSHKAETQSGRAPPLPPLPTAPAGGALPPGPVLVAGLGTESHAGMLRSQPSLGSPEADCRQKPHIPELPGGCHGRGEVGALARELPQAAGIARKPKHPRSELRTTAPGGQDQSGTEHMPKSLWSTLRLWMDSVHSPRDPKVQATSSQRRKSRWALRNPAPN